jgi:hypothetical protein
MVVVAPILVVLQMTTISYQANSLKATVMTKVSLPVQPLKPAIPLLLPFPDSLSKSSNASSASKDHSKYINESRKRLFLPEDVLTSKKTTAQQGGRPKGTTEAAAEELERNMELATQESVLLFKEKRKENRSSKKRLRYGLLDDIIKSAKKKYSVPDDVTIRKDCIRQRVKRNSASNHAG